MSIFGKRALAFLIDSALFGLLYSAVSLCVLANQHTIWRYVFFLFAILLFLCRDLLFRHCSLGKKIVGIAVLTDNWQIPRPITLIKRSLLTLITGYAVLWKAKHVDGSVIGFFDWERETLHTQVVDLNVARRLYQEALREGNASPTELTNRYAHYLQDLYVQ